jgi:hypothetical protein
MKKTKTVAGLATAGVLIAGLGAAVLPANAQQRVLRVTLLGGQVITVTVDAPPGVPADQIPLPGLATPVVGVEDITPPAQTPPPAAEQPPATSGQPPAASQDPEAPAVKGGAEEQESSGSAKRPERKRDGEEADEAPEGEASPTTERKAERAQRDAEEAAEAGVPTPADPGFSLAEPGPAPIGVPNFFIEKFAIPPFLLPIYQAAGIEYGVRWEILAAINEIETDYGRNLNVSSAGALGWMQFMPATWKAYGTDANRDGRKDPYNPVDAIFAAARYLKAAGAETDLRKAIFAYNHADWYVDSVLLRARLISGIPADLVGSLSGLTQGHFPVHAEARYTDDIEAREAERKIAKGRNAAVPVEAEEGRRGIEVFADEGSPAIAVQDGRIVKIGRNERLGKFVMLRDVYGNTYTYAHLGEVAKAHPVAKEQAVTREGVREELGLPAKDPKPSAPASAGVQAPAPPPEAVDDLLSADDLAEAKAGKERLFANPSLPMALEAGGEEQLLDAGAPLADDDTFKAYFTQRFGLSREDVVLKRLKVGSKVIAGTVLGRLGASTEKKASHLLFEIRPAGKGAPRIDPKPILDGWKLLESTAIYRAAGKNPFFGPDAKNPSIGQILLMSKEALQRRVADNPRIELYECGRRDVLAGAIDRRVLATLEFLAASGLRPSVTSLRCGHSFLTKSGNVSHHSSGNAVDIAKVNGIPVIGNQGRGSVTDMTIRRLLTLQGTMRPSQIISLMTYEGADNTLSLPDHADHIHIGWAPLYDPTSKRGREMEAILKPSQWVKLIDRLGQIDNPVVPTKPSKYALKVHDHRASKAHKGE